MATITNRPALRELSLPGQLLAWYLILLPLSTLLLTTATPTPQGVMGRLQVFALGADAVLHPVVGLFIGTFLAAYFQQNRLRRLYSVLAGLGGVTLLVMAPFFLLDAIQARGRVTPQMMRLYDMHTVRTSGMFLVVGVVLVLLAVVGWRALQRELKVTAAAREDASSTLVGSATRSSV